MVKRAAVLCFVLATAAGAATFAVDGGTVTIDTARYRAQWRDGCLVAWRTKLPAPADLTVGGEMTPEQIPSGLCSLAGQEQAAREQHHPWNFLKLDATFPAQHPAGAESKLTTAKIPGGLRLSYQGLTGEPGATLVQELVVEEGSGDLLLRQSAKSPNPGVVGIAFSLLNVRGDIELAMPYFGGQRWGREFAEGRVIGIAYTQFWHAGLVIGEVPGGGSFMVWAEDPRMRPKHFYLRHQGTTQGLSFEGLPESPYDTRTSAELFTWRLNTYAGSWMEPAARYKDWLVKTHALVKRSERPSNWVDDIALLWPTSPSEAAMDQMAERIDPKHVLLMQWGWLEGFNRRVPEYLAKNDEFGEWVAKVHQRGYRVGVYTSVGLVDVKAWPELETELGFGYLQSEPWQERKSPATKPDQWLWYIHPGSAKWREFYARRMKESVERYGLDYLYQDVSGCGVGSSGLVDGLGYHEAMVAGETAIREQVPRAALGGEFWTEVNVCREDFAIGSFLAWNCGQTWDGKHHAAMLAEPGQAHPLLGYLFNDYAIRWPHNVPTRDVVKFHQSANPDEVTGAAAVWATSADDDRSEARVTMAKARLWAAGFRPWYPERWEPGVVGYLRSRAGEVVRYRRAGRSTTCWRGEGPAAELVFARLNGERAVDVGRPMQIDGWAAYGERGPIGLDPASWYCAFPGRSGELPVTVTALPAEARVVDTRIADGWVLVGLDGQGAGELRWRCARQPLAVSTATASPAADAGQVTETLPTQLLFGFVEPGRPAVGDRLALPEWDHRLVANGLFVQAGQRRAERKLTYDGVTHTGCVVFPPSGGAGAEYSIDGYVHLPDEPKLALRVWLGILGKIGDGVHFVVRINGREVARRFRETKQGWEEWTAPLGDYAGRTVLLSLAVDAGKAGFNLSCDDAVWGDPTLVR